MAFPLIWGCGFDLYQYVLNYTSDARLTTYYQYAWHLKSLAQSIICELRKSPLVVRKEDALLLRSPFQYCGIICSTVASILNSNNVQFRSLPKQFFEYVIVKILIRCQPKH